MVKTNKTGNYIENRSSSEKVASIASERLGANSSITPIPISQNTIQNARVNLECKVLNAKLFSPDATTFFKNYEVISCSKLPPELSVKQNGYSIKGENILIRKNGVPLYRFTGGVIFYKDHCLIKGGTTFIDYNQAGEPSTKYFVKLDTSYYHETPSGADSSYILKNFSTGELSVKAGGKKTILEWGLSWLEEKLIVTEKKGKANEISIEQLDNSVSFLHFDSRRWNNKGHSKLGLESEEGKIKYRRKDHIFEINGENIKIRGNVSDWSSSICAQFFSNKAGRDVRLKFRPVKQGIKVHAEYASQEKTEALYLGTITDETIKMMENMRRVSSEEYAKIAERLKKRFGGQRAFKIRDYFAGPWELKFVRAVAKASELSHFSFNFVATVALEEGLIIWLKEKYYSWPGSQICGFLHLGTDYFYGEKETLVKNGYLRSSFREGTRDEILFGQTGDYYKSIDLKVPQVVYRSIEPALEVVVAQLAYKRDIFLADVRKYFQENGKTLDLKKTLTQDQMDYWTYLYYNSGHGAGAKELVKRLDQKGLAGLKIPKEPAETKMMSNPQRIMATKKLMDMVYEPPESVVQALAKVEPKK